MKEKLKNSKTLPAKVYHGVPQGWSSADIAKQHAAIGACHGLVVPEETEPGAPSWLPDRYNWLQYRATVRALVDGIREKCPACIELAIRCIELDYIGSYSGYLKAKLARTLYRAPIDPQQADRLIRHFDTLAATGQRRHEWGSFQRLLERLRRERSGL